MEKVNYGKLVIDIIYEGYNSDWSVEKIGAKTIQMDYDIFMNKDLFPVEARESICDRVREHIPQVYKVFTEDLGEYLISDLIDGKRCYKKAMPGDEARIYKCYKRTVRIKKQAENRFDKRLSNVKEKKLLTDKEIKSLLSEDDIKELVNEG